MKTGRKALTVFLIVGLLLGAAGCKNADEPSKITETQEQDETKQEKKDLTNAETEAGASDTVTAMGRYMEHSFPLPDGADLYCRKLQLLSDGSLAYFDGYRGLFLSKDGGESWTAEKKIGEIAEESNDSYMNASAIGADKSVAVNLMDFGDEHEISSTVIFVDAKGNRVSADGTFDDGDFIDRLAIAPDGAVYAASVRGKVCILDTEEGRLKKVFTAAEGPEMMAFLGTQMLLLENDRVEILNRNQHALQEADIVLDEFCRENLNGHLGVSSDCVGAALLSAEEGVVYIACNQGIYRHVLGGNAMEQLIDGDFSAFGDPTVGICSVAALPDGDFLLLSSKNEMLRFTYDENEPTVPEIQLHVYSLRENRRLRQGISIFQKDNPDCYVKYEIGMPKNSAVTLTDAVRNLNLELMGGNGPDVLLLDGLDAEVYANKGLLKDLSPILNPMLEKKEVFENIASAYQKDEGAFVIPSSFQLPLILGKSEDIENVTDLESLTALVERLSGTVPGSSVTGSFSPQQEISQLLPVCSPAWLSDGKLEEAALKEFLIQAKRIYEADIKGVDDWTQENFGQYPGASPIGENAVSMQVGLAQIAYGLSEDYAASMGAVAHYTEEEEGYVCRLWAGQAGTGFVPYGLLAVPAAAAQPQLAEGFVKLLLSSELQETYTDEGFPVNRASFDTVCKNAEGSFGSGWHMPDGDREAYYEVPKEETQRELIKFAEAADCCLTGNAIVEEAVLNYGSEVLSGTLPLDEGVKKIKDRISLYLAEQR